MFDVDCDLHLGSQASAGLQLPSFAHLESSPSWGPGSSCLPAVQPEAVPPVLPELRITSHNDIDTNLGVQPGLCFNDIVQFVACKNCNPHEVLLPSSVLHHLPTEIRDVDEDTVATAQARVTLDSS
jgi:hypothetical protein